MTEFGDAAEIVKSGAFDKIADVFHRLAGPLADEIGLMMAEKTREYRLRNMIKVFERTKSILREANLPESAVPPRIFLPLLDSASLEEDESLQELWAGLLASGSQESDTLSPGFIETLKQLTPQQAKALNECFELSRTIGSADLGTPEQLAEILFPEKDGSTFRLTMNAFERLGIFVKVYDLQKRFDPLKGLVMSYYTPAQPFAETYPLPQALIMNNYMPAMNPDNKDDLPELTFRLGFTEYGIQFMRACQGPRKCDGK